MKKFFPYFAGEHDSYRINEEDAKEYNRIRAGLVASGAKYITKTVDEKGNVTYSPKGAEALEKYKPCQKIDDVDIRFRFQPEKRYWELSDEHIQLLLKLEKENFDWLKFYMSFTPSQEIYHLEITVKEYGKNKQKAMELLPCFSLELIFKYKKGRVYFNDELKGCVH